MNNGKRGFLSELSQVIQYKELLKNLTICELKTRYKRSVLGYFWIMLNPLLMMLVMYVVFSNFFPSVENYAVYLISGLVLWNFYAQSTSAAKYSFIAKGNLIRKAYFPKAVLPLSSIFSECINFCFTLIPLFIILALSGFFPGTRLLLMPFCVLEVLLFAMGVSLFMSTLVLIFHDVNYIYDVILLAWMYFTPVFWPAEMLPKAIHSMLQFNPLYHYLSLFRGLLYDVNVDAAALAYHFGVGAGFSIAALIVGVWVYMLNKNRLVFYL